MEMPNAMSLSRILVMMASIVIVVAGLRAAEAIVVPFLFSLFLAIIVSPMLDWLKRRQIPTAVAIALVILAVTIVGLLLIAYVGKSLADFLHGLPENEQRLQQRKDQLLAWLKTLGIDLKPAASSYLETRSLMELVRSLPAGLSEAFSNAFLILITTIFLLVEATVFPAKLRALPGSSDAVIERLDRIVEGVRQYMAIKTWVSLLTGVLAALWLIVLGVHYPLLWGLLASLLNFIPNIGSILAALPPMLLSLLQLGPGTAVMTGLGYVTINTAIGYGIEPRWMGRGLDLSTLVVFLSLVFWGWVLGPAGMLLSVPLTMTVKIAMESMEGTRWIAALLSESPQDVQPIAEI